MKKIVNSVTGLGFAVWICGVAALVSVGLAFLGADAAGEVMRTPVPQVLTLLLAALLGFVGMRAVFRKRYDSALLHFGAACVMAGWLLGCHAVRAASQTRPASGSMAMIGGDVSDTLWGGAYLTNYVGRVPFTVKLEKFLVTYYDANALDRDAGRMPPVKEYRSRVTITERGREPYVANVRVNHPVRVQDYLIYQMSWGQSQDMAGNPVTYTVLQFIRDPGLPLVYAGFGLLFAGVLLVAARVLRVNLPAAEEGGRHDA